MNKYFEYLTLHFEFYAIDICKPDFNVDIVDRQNRKQREKQTKLSPLHQ